MQVMVSLIRQIYQLELPRLWDEELVEKQRRAGRGWKTGSEELGAAWEGILVAVLRGVTVREILFSFFVVSGSDGADPRSIRVGSLGPKR